MKRFFLAAAAALCLAAPAESLAQNSVPIVKRAEDCIQANADRIAASEPSLEAAANFLLSYTCANEVSGATRYRRNIVWLDAVRSMTKAMLGQVPPATMGPGAGMSAPIRTRVDPETGEFILPSPRPGEPQNPFDAMLPQMSVANSQMMPDTPAADLRKLAGDLLLRSRERGRPTAGSR